MFIFRSNHYAFQTWITKDEKASKPRIWKHFFQTTPATTQATVALAGKTTTKKEDENEKMKCCVEN